MSCPWCYIGHKRLEKALQNPSTKERPFRVETVRLLSRRQSQTPNASRAVQHFKPWLINVDYLPSSGEPITRQELFAKKFMTPESANANRSKISKAGEAEGIKFRWTDV